MKEALIDTDILSYFLKGDIDVIKKVRDYLEHVQNSINRLQAGNFILYFVRFFRHSCRLCLQNLPRLKQNFLAFARSWKFEQALNGVPKIEYLYDHKI